MVAYIKMSAASEENLAFFDTETTGLFSTVNGQTPHYSDINKYDNARLLQVCIITTTKELVILEKTVLYVKVDFPINNSHIHGITREITDNKGLPIDEVLRIFMEKIIGCKHIIAHNIEFDINIIRSEMWRANMVHRIPALDKLISVCSCELFRQELNLITTRDGRTYIKRPSLVQLYAYATGYNIVQKHEAEEDTMMIISSVKTDKLNKIFTDHLNASREGVFS